MLFFLLMQAASVTAVPSDACVEAARSSRQLPALDAFLAGRRLPGIATRGVSQGVAAPSGATVAELFARVGQPVQAGALLGRLHAAALDRELAMLDPDLAASAAESAQFDADVQRLVREHERRQAHPELFAREERDAHVALLAGARARLVQAQARARSVALHRHQLEQQRELLELRAPMDSVVSSVLVHVGESVIAGAHLLELTPIVNAQARFAMPPGALGQLAIGTHVCLQAGDTAPIPARITFLAATIEPSAQAIIAEATVDADADPASVRALLPGSAIDVVPVAWPDPLP
ncbi:MAG: HlyD family efflux transporter periplasmic adaptor subunit [Tahibacter sp.]